jgi:secreted trypsin-like serine protease
MKLRTVSLLFVLIFACAGIAYALSSGTLDTVHSYVGAGIIPNVLGETGFTGGDGFIACSGTLVSPRVFLTAGHCVDAVVTAAITSELVITFDATNIFPPPPDALRVASVALMPGFQATSGETPDINDVGVVILAQPVHNISPVRLAPVGFLDQLSALNKGTVSLVGYGLNQQLVWTGQREIESANVVNFSDTWIKYSPGTCTGDNGGPTLLVYDGIEYQIGLHSTITSNTGHGSIIDGCGPNGYDTRIDTVAVQSFVQAQIGANP